MFEQKDWEKRWEWSRRIWVFACIIFGVVLMSFAWRLTQIELSLALFCVGVAIFGLGMTSMEAEPSYRRLKDIDSKVDTILSSIASMKKRTKKGGLK